MDEYIEAVRATVYQIASDRFMSQEKRFGMEVDLVEDAAPGHLRNEEVLDQSAEQSGHGSSWAGGDSFACMLYF